MVEVLRTVRGFALETYEQVREAAGADLALTVRYGVDTLDAPHGMGDVGIRVAEDGGAFMEMADHLVDLWDLTVGWIEWGEQATSSRTHPENSHGRDNAPGKAAHEQTHGKCRGD